MSRVPRPALLVALLATLPVLACSSASDDLGAFSGADGGATTEGGTSSHGDAAASGLDAAPDHDGSTGHPDDSGAHDAMSDSTALAEGGGTPTAIDYAPYFPTWVWGGSGYAFTGLPDLQKKATLNEVTIAFVLSNGGCDTTQDIEQNMSDVQAFLAGGGHLKASFGGADGDYVESKCSDANSLATAIEGFVTATGITDLDFDI